MPELRTKPAVAASAPRPLDYVRNAGLGRTRRLLAWMDRHRRLLIVTAIVIALPSLTFVLPAALTTETKGCRRCGTMATEDIKRVAGIPYGRKRYTDAKFARLYAELLEAKHDHEWCLVYTTRCEGTLWGYGDPKGTQNLRGYSELSAVEARLGAMRVFAPLPVEDRRAVFEEILAAGPSVELLFERRDALWLAYRPRLIKSAGSGPTHPASSRSSAAPE